MGKFAAAVVLGVLLVTSACGGGGSGSRPSKAEVSKALTRSGDNSVLGSNAGRVSKQAADCIAGLLVDSGISDPALKAIVDGDKTYRPSARDQKAAQKLASKIVTCLPAGS